MEKELYKFKTLRELIDARSRETSKGIRFIKSSDEEEFISYARFYEEVLLFLNVLQSDRKINEGDEIIIYEEDNHKFLIGHWACLLGGFIPVPLAVGGKEDHKLKFFRIWDNLINPNVFTSKENLEKLVSFGVKKMLISDENILKDHFLDSSETFTSKIKGLPLIPSPDDLAFIQYSSGSTGNPKGVMLTHENLIYNTYDVTVSIDVKEDDNFFCWIPLTHDMGMIAFHLTSMIAGCNQMIMPTSLFIRRPLLWMEKTHEHRATKSCSPNFGYEYFLQAFNRKSKEEITWDLSCMKTIINGAEPISEEICSDFITALSEYGFPEYTITACYGLAEGSVGVTASDLKTRLHKYFVTRESLTIGNEIDFKETFEEGKTLSFVEVGPTLLSCKVIINDEEGNSLGKNKLGYIDIKGKNVTKGYYHNSKETESVFTKDGWLRTGDLGFLLDNNSLVITGRSKNMIIFQGQNYYAHDIENLIIGTTNISSGKVAVCGISGNDKEQEKLIAFVYFKKKAPHFLETIFAIQDRLSEVLDIIPDMIIPIREIPKTTSGKVQHSLLLKRYQDGLFDDIIEEINIELIKNTIGEYQFAKNELTKISNWLKEQCIKILNVESVDLKVDLPLADQGFKSIHAVQLSQTIKTRLGIISNQTILYKFPTIQKLSKYINNKLFLSSEEDNTSKIISNANDDSLISEIENLTEEEILNMLEI